MAEADVIGNNHHDEEVEISDAESVPDNQDDSEPSDAEDGAAVRGAGLSFCPPLLPPHCRSLVHACVCKCHLFYCRVHGKMLPTCCADTFSPDLVLVLCRILSPQRQQDRSPRRRA